MSEGAGAIPFYCNLDVLCHMFSVLSLFGSRVSAHVFLFKRKPIRLGSTCEVNTLFN